MAKKKPRPKTAKPTTATKTSSSNSGSNSINDEMIAAALNETVHQPVLMKVCRLCETRDGPFLNIFGADTDTAKKIEELMPFRVTENDELPHKICFRCSAKVEELYEFIDKCTKTQESLHTKLGKKPMKTKTRLQWEEKLSKSNLTNDFICDALVRKAMEGIKDIPLQDKDRPLLDRKNKTESLGLKRNASTESDDDQDHVSLEQFRSTVNNPSPTPVTRTRSNKAEPLLEGLEPPPKKVKSFATRKLQSTPREPSPPPVIDEPEITEIPDESPPAPKFNLNSDKNKLENDFDETKAEKSNPVFNIMDHVSIIKVNGVGILFQCKLCNRNFLKKDVLVTHGCAKNNVPKDITQGHAPLPEPPKPSTVKYITLDKDFKTQPRTKASVKDHEPKKDQPPVKAKPKIGPASKVRRDRQETEAEIDPRPIPKPAENPTIIPSVNFPGTPNLSSRYKLLAGPNNSFMLVEDSTKPGPVESKTPQRQEPPKKPVEILVPTQPAKEPPYPVGLFQTVPHRTNMYTAPLPQPPTFTTPAMKKQSYTIVQTGNPSKLLISTKPQPIPEEPPKKHKKSKPDAKNHSQRPDLEEGTSNKRGFFTFVNLDPETQPSYVLPTDNIIQESQISTSTPVSKVVDEKNKYVCNMCNESFSREKKLLSHIQSHYNMMDMEDEVREKTTKRKGKKS